MQLRIRLSSICTDRRFAEGTSMSEVLFGGLNAFRHQGSNAQCKPRVNPGANDTSY